MRTEIQLLKEWMEAKTLEHEDDPEVDRILNEPPIQDEDFSEEEIRETVDTASDLVEVFRQITRPHKRRFIGDLFRNRQRFVSPNGSPQWINAEDIEDYLDVTAVPNKPRAFPAWVLSNQRGSKQYFGEWLERRGKRLKDNTFKTTEYRIRPQALQALEEIFGG